jgi:hypothetical protein
MDRSHEEPIGCASKQCAGGLAGMETIRCIGWWCTKNSVLLLKSRVAFGDNDTY